MLKQIQSVIDTIKPVSITIEVIEGVQDFIQQEAIREYGCCSITPENYLSFHYKGVKVMIKTIIS